MTTPLRIGISSCLLGQPVRYDGGHKLDHFLVETLGRFVEFVPVCPEVEVGLGTPRETLRLVRRQDELRLIMANGDDHTRAMRRYAARRVRDLGKAGLSGFVLKKDSPSCGVERVRVYPEPRRPGVAVTPERNGRGLFADALLRGMPSLPVEEEGRLRDPRLRDNFVERIFAYRRLRALFDNRWTLGDLVAFHTAHKLTVLAHSPEAYRSLGRLVAEGRSVGRATLRDRYAAGLMAALTRLATPRKHANVLMHMVGYLRGRIDTASRDELLETIDDYRQGLLPLVVPVTLMKHHVRQCDIAYLAGQVYLDPHPKELMLRNHV